MSPNLTVPPLTARNLHNSLVYFKIPKSLLDRKIRIFLLASNDQATDRFSMIPTKMLGSTDTLDSDLKTIL
jgi:hypothetical protein